MKQIPIIHTTDLYQPVWDPDDQIDLAICYALKEFDVRAVICDNHSDARKMLMHEPAFGLITQLNWMTGRSVPFGISPTKKLTSAEDDCASEPLREQGGINLMIQQLRESPEPVFVSVVGSSRTLAAVINREPELAKEKIRAVILVAGTPFRYKDSKFDTNTRFDQHAYYRVFTSGIPIWWFPPNSGMAFNKLKPEDYTEELKVARKEGLKHAVKFTVPHEQLFSDLPTYLHNWLMIGFAGHQRGDIIRALHENYGGIWWSSVSQAIRAISSPIALATAAGRKIAKTDRGWRFVTPEEAENAQEIYKHEMLPVKVNIDPDGHTTWEYTDESHIKLFTRDGDQDRYAEIMGEVVNRTMVEELTVDTDFQVGRSMHDCNIPGFFDHKESSKK